jgi:peptide-methionine (R)-S-oxide reductase
MSTLEKPNAEETEDKLELTEEEWRRRLDPARFRILRQQGTEPAFTGAYAHHHEKGRYRCAGCGAPLFASETKYDSGSGWPSFYEPADPKRVETQTDASHGMTRTEVHCARCGGHLGHVFPDGPRPTGLRYCVNSASLDFEPADEG